VRKSWLSLASLDPKSRPLTVREREVIELIDAGQASKQIADTLKISTNTVNNHRAAILSKLGAHSAIEALRIYRDLEPDLSDDNTRP